MSSDENAVQACSPLEPQRPGSFPVRSRGVRFATLALMTLGLSGGLQSSASGQAAASVSPVAQVQTETTPTRLGSAFSTAINRVFLATASSWLVVSGLVSWLERNPSQGGAPWRRLDPLAILERKPRRRGQRRGLAAPDPGSSATVDQGEPR